MVEHLVQALVDLSVGLDDLLAEFLGAAAEILRVEILLDVFADLSADGLLGNDFGPDRLGGRLAMPGREPAGARGLRRPAAARRMNSSISSATSGGAGRGGSGRPAGG